MLNRRAIGLGLLGASAMFLLSGCDVLPLPDEQRYQYINAVKDDLGYASAGEVILERYDTGDGSFFPSFFMHKLMVRKLLIL